MYFFTFHFTNRKTAMHNPFINWTGKNTPPHTHKWYHRKGPMTAYPFSYQRYQKVRNRLKYLIYNWCLVFSAIFVFLFHSNDFWIHTSFKKKKKKSYTQIWKLKRNAHELLETYFFSFCLATQIMSPVYPIIFFFFKKKKKKGWKVLEK